MPRAWKVRVFYHGMSGIRLRSMESLLTSYTKARKEARRLEALGYKTELECDEDRALEARRIG